MNVRRGIYLGAALLLGIALATSIGFWEDRNSAQQAPQLANIKQTALVSPAARQVEYVSRAVGSKSGRPDGPPAIDDHQVVPASFEEPEHTATDEPSAAGPPAEAVGPAAEPSEPAAPASESPAEPADQSAQPTDQSAVEATTPPDKVASAAEDEPAELPQAALAEGPITPGADPIRQAGQVEGPHPQSSQSPAAEQPASASEAASSADAVDGVPLAWHDNYRLAMDAAVEQQRMLLIYFFDPKGGEQQAAFERESFGNAELHKQLNKDYVLARLPVGAAITSSGERIELLKHASFFEMRGRAGVAVLDFAHPRADYFGTVVSAFPLMSGKYYSRPKLATVLSLPAGTLTQRTMIYAVRVHPEAPASTQGQFNNVLADEATRHSEYQANILVQGHQNWDSRFQRINSRLRNPVLAEEVVAESWPSENLVEACIDCVDSWRHSPGHWQAVRSRHRLFGFDIHRGRNGIWYATGIFSQH